ncbi:MAG: hypothetical protein Q4A86_00885 [Clostridia bacterium]|nr:hypothetical protein [Clostridia bacterium]
MGLTYSFVDNVAYGPEDINDITRSLTGAGVAPFVSKDSYNVSDLNVMTSALVGTGVELDGCKCSIKNAGTEGMAVTVAKGIVFFESGARMTVDEEGYVLYIIPNVAGWVYAYYNPALQKANIEFSSELPTDGEYVLLAEVLADGSIMDKRAYAKSKVATMGKNVSLTIPFTAMEKTFIREDSGSRYFAVARASGVDSSKFNYALVLSAKISSASGVPYGCFYDLTRDKGLFSLRGDYDPPVCGNLFLTGMNYSLWYAVEMFNNELCIVAQCSIMNGGEKYIDENLFSAYTATFM